MTKDTLQAESVLPITLELELDRNKNGECHTETLRIQCHGYIYEAGGDITLFRAEAGALKIFAGFNRVFAYRELEAN
jgi:hypothetical protein